MTGLIAWLSVGTLLKAGDFRFYCSLHGTATSGMDGGVRVEG